jgi:hypothetical protein
MLRVGMHWIVQEGMYSEAGYRDLCDALVRMNVPHTFVKPVPFTTDLIPDPAVENPVMVCGAMSMIKAAKKRGWTPGAFFNENFRFECWYDHYGDEMLNADARVCRFDEVDDYFVKFFIRPTEDTKSFNGQLLTWPDFEAWRKQVLAIPPQDRRTLGPETMVVVASPKTIYREYRFFVVDGEIVSGSQYKLGDAVIHDARIDSDITDYVKRIVGVWQPDRAFCLDIALTPDGPKVLEINCINSAGFYAIDVMRFVAAIESMTGYGEDDARLRA